MKYLAGNVQASVTILYPVCRWLSGRDAVAYEVMTAALQPAHVVNGGSTALLATLRVGRDIGLLERLGTTRTSDESANWALRPPVLDQSEEWYSDPVRFRGLVRRALLAKAADDIDVDETPSDVAVGLAWLLAHDPVRPLPQAFGDGPERALNDQKLDSYIASPEQWRAFYRWAVALGCAEYSQIGNRRLILPDPTAALAEELPPIPPAGMPAREFHTVVGKALPVLDGGLISEFMRRERAECADPRGDAMVGPAFSLALRRLKGRGVIGLEREADAGHRVDGMLHGKRWVFDRVTLGSENGDA
jgi:hypothetical protein